MMTIKAGVNLECEAKSVDECQAGMYWPNELPIEHRVWHRSGVSDRVGGV